MIPEAIALLLFACFLCYRVPGALGEGVRNVFAAHVALVEECRSRERSNAERIEQMKTTLAALERETRSNAERNELEVRTIGALQQHVTAAHHWVEQLVASLDSGVNRPPRRTGQTAALLAANRKGVGET